MEAVPQPSEIPLKHITSNICVKILSYLRNKEILAAKLVCRQFYAVLANPLTLRLCLETQQPKAAADDIRTALSLYISKKSSLSGAELETQLAHSMSQMNLLVLNLSGLGIHGQETAQLICAALIKQKTYIEKLDLSGNNLSKDTINPFIAYLEKSSQIREVNLKNAKLCKQGIERLCAVMSLSKGIRSLNLSDNMIGSTGAKQLAEMLKRNHSLEKLYLQRTYLGKEGVSCLLEALEANTTLRTLHLEENKVSAKSVRSGSSGRITKICV